MEEKIIKAEDFITTKWSGGETSQLYIYPENADFSKKDFLFRISSATFTGCESTFSDFSNYYRYILPLEGSLSVDHKNLYKRSLSILEPEFFDGGWKTYSENSLDCRDYNFIFSKKARGDFKVIKTREKVSLKENGIYTFFSKENFSLRLNDKKREIPAFSLYLLKTEVENTNIEIEDLKDSIIISEFFK
ncbi:HutD family protein [Neofamilia massiliensis]|uniref:HutD family protein n=1 Tax=Neofamilia massiliensis TaxID=1673724 RepID=UPI0006BB8292|nr:HutD family protein [Neofamilia massiliensis]